MDKNSFLIALCESERTDLGRVDFDQQNELQRVFSAIWVLESEVNNGGFDQYFRNTDSTVILHAPAALRTIRANTCAGIVERAIQMISPLPATEGGRYSMLDALGDDGQDRLGALDSEFYGYPDNLTELLFAFVHQNQKTFGPVPDL